MNTAKLKSVMIEHGDTQEDLAEAIGVSRVTYHKKLNGAGSEFTQSEIDMIRKRYSLTPEEVESIFFSDCVS